jgi:hypothetical protein
LALLPRPQDRRLPGHHEEILGLKSVKRKA